MVNAPRDTKRKPKLTKIGLWLLPWFPATVIFGFIRFRSPATEWILVEKMRMNAPSIYYSRAQQLEQTYPGIHLFAWVLIAMALAFVIGIVTLAVGYYRIRAPAVAAKTI